MYLTGDFNNWQSLPAYRMKKVKRSNGVWEIELKPEAMKHGDLYKLKIIWEGGEGERIPSYANRVVQDEVTKIFSAQVWAPEKPYHFRKKVAKTDMEIYAGIFPRRVMGGVYSQAFFSDSLSFYDNNLEGILLKFKRPNAEFEVGCDWMGQYSENQRERFMIFTSGEGQVAPVMSVGYAGYMYHFANTWHIKGLVDNFLLNPYIRLDFAQYTGLQKLSATVGYYIFPRGVHLDLEARKWNAAIISTGYMTTATTAQACMTVWSSATSHASESTSS